MICKSYIADQHAFLCSIIIFVYRNHSCVDDIGNLTRIKVHKKWHTFAKLPYASPERLDGVGELGFKVLWLHSETSHHECISHITHATVFIWWHKHSYFERNSVKFFLFPTKISTNILTNTWTNPADTLRNNYIITSCARWEFIFFLSPQKHTRLFWLPLSVCTHFSLYHFLSFLSFSLCVALSFPDALSIYRHKYRYR